MSPAGNRLCVLVIETDDAIRATMEWLLSEGGYRVRGARTCAEARAGWESGGLDVILRDLVVDGPEGPETTVRLAGTLGARVVFMCGMADQSLARRALTREGVWLLPKPFSPDVLLRTLEEILRA